MSHEIRTPMNGIIGTADLLSRSPLGAKQAKYVDILRGSGGQLLTLINDILDFSKIEAGKLDIETVDFDLPGQVHDVVALLRARLADKPVTIQTSLAVGEHHQVHGDPNRVRQVLLNILGNAVKFTPAGCVELSISRISNELVRFEVRDTGVGIPESHQALIFQPFEQGDGSTSRRFGGTGLGLAISRQLVGLMGGEIGFQSTLNQGSVFWFTVKLLAATGAGAGPPDAGTHHLSGHWKTSARVLVVDDVDVNRVIATAVLEALGCTVVEAVDGESAIELAIGGGFDLVLMDCQMPVLDGLEATRRIRQHEAVAGGHVVIVACTANAMKGDAEACLAAGMDAYVSKPFSAIGLEREMRKWLNAWPGVEPGNA